MRVIAGTYRSRQLRSLRGLDLRPTADRLRETLFDVLTAGNPAALEGSGWIDLYAGTGAVGIEGLSRGAEKVYFVESAKSAAELIRQNLASLEITSRFEILQQDVIRALRNLATRGIAGDFVFLDPPYQMEEAYKDALRALAELNVLKPNAVVITEHEKRFDPGDGFAALRRYRTLDQGDAALSFYRKT